VTRTTRTTLRLAAAGAAAAAALFASPAHATPDTDCADYPSRAVAQAEFVLHGGSPTNNWHGLDNDHDGFVCEHHQFPGEPTPPPNPGPSGCAVCPSPSPSIMRPPASPSAPPMLPVTGSAGAGWLALGGGLAVAFGTGAVVLTRRRRSA
jgi:LPXTG-motif cell wall-anchored protein